MKKAVLREYLKNREEMHNKTENTVQKATKKEQNAQRNVRKAKKGDK